MRVIAFTYEADHHCFDCTIRRFKGTEGIDSEGNPVGAVFSTDEWYNIGEGNQTLNCSDCGIELDTYDEDDV